VNILAFDTSTSVCSVAIQYKNETQSLHQIAPMQQGQFILPMINQLLNSFSITLSQFDAIAFGCGPGSFTGTRMACSVVQGIAFALNLPVIPISSMAAIAQSIYLERQWPNLFIALDARMNQIYWAIYQVQQEEMVVLGNEVICSPNDVHLSNLPNIMHWHHATWRAAGDGWEKYQNKIIMSLKCQPEQIITTCFPRAEAILALAKRKYERKNWMSVYDAMPVYLR
jgi:tRNA threonylcarbamoyladenosine biosynthesis protein TsaB